MAGWDERAASATGGGLSNTGAFAGPPSLALDTSGNPHIAWGDWSSGNVEIYYAYWDGTSWVTHGGANTGGGVSNNAGQSDIPSLALDANGNPHIAWMDCSSGNCEIYYAYWDGANWVTHGGANTGGGLSNTGALASPPSLALDTSGNPHIAWQDGTYGNREIYYAYWNGANWVTHSGGNTGGGVSNNAGESFEPSLALDSSGNPHIAWWDNSGGDREIYYAYWDGANWVTHGGANTGGGMSNTGDVSTFPSLALDSSGNPHIAWQDGTYGNREIYYAYWNGANWVTHSGGNTGGGVSNNAGESFEPSLALDSSGNPHIAWWDNSGGDWEIYYAYWDGTSWVTHGGANTGGGLSNNAGDSRSPSLALDSSGNPHIAWWDSYKIYYRYWTCPSLLPKICRTCPPMFIVKKGKTACKSFKIWNCGRGTLNWTVSKEDDCPWLTLNPLSGTSTRKKSKVTACVDTTGLDKGEYECTVTITGDCATNSPQTCVIKLKVK